MPDREKVMAALKCVANLETELTADCRRKGCPYAGKGDCERLAAEDALALLKEQEPRVMTLEEVESLPDETDVFLEEVDCIVVAATISRQGEKWGVFPDTTFFYGIESTSYGSDEYDNGDYGRWWRCWTARPTEEQRKAVKWDD